MRELKATEDRLARRTAELREVREALETTGMPTHGLKLELTESMLMGDAATVEKALDDLAAMGVSLALDDFGTGYSSLTYLKRLPVDTIKLDRSFVRDLLENGDARELARSAIDMLHALRKIVVAEGVELPGQRALLTRWGCDLLQGWLFTRSLAADDFRAFVLRPPLAMSGPGEGSVALARQAQSLEQALELLGTIPDKAPGAEKDSPALVKLGKELYFEKALSKNNSQSCNSCHVVDKGRGGVDNEPTSPGAFGKRGGRNSPTVLNAGFHLAQFWDGRAATLEDQAKGPILNPVEMAMPDSKVVIERLSADKGYQKAFKAAFPGEPTPIHYDNVANAIAAFERTLVTKDRYDDFLKGKDTALNASELRGLELFLTAGGVLKVNELAPRPHNSGHPSLDACDLSQFELQLRTLVGWPLVQPRLHSPTVMINLMGDLWFPGGTGTQATEPDWPAVLALPGVHLHLYGKAEARPARKMGHLTITASHADAARAVATRALQVLGLPPMPGAMPA